jgi:hypothetical protein
MGWILGAQASRTVTSAPWPACLATFVSAS